MFAKKPSPEPKLPGIPPVFRINAGNFTLMPSEPPPILEQHSEEGLERISEQAPPVRIAEAIVSQAFREQAEQIRLTPNETVSAVDYLIAGKWRDTMNIPRSLWPGVVAAYKEKAGLPLWEYRMALQGLLLIRYDARDYDIHLAIHPTRYGEKITMRIEAAVAPV